MRINIVFAAAPACAALALPATVAAQSLVCSVEMSTGFSFDKDKGKWTPTTFRSDAKFVVRRSSNPKLKYEVVQLGSKGPTAFCEKEFQQGHLRCSGFGHEFLFNRNDMRFLNTYTVGYWNETTINGISPGRKEGDDTPAMNAGTCAALE